MKKRKIRSNRSANEKVSGPKILHPIDRRGFLRASTVAAGGVLMAYSKPKIVMAQGTRDIYAPNYNCNEVPSLQDLMESFPFSAEASENIAAATAIAQGVCQGQTPSDSQLDTLWQLGWLPGAEVNDDQAAREVVNSILMRPAGPWNIEPDNQSDYLPPDYSVSRSRLGNFFGECQSVECLTVAAAGAVIILAIVLVAIMARPAE